MTRDYFKMPARSALAATLAAALALTPITATPARAGDQNDVGAIAAFSLLALITAGLVATSVARRDEPRHAGRPYSPNPGPRVDPRKALPAQCEFTVRRGHDRGTYYGSRCLKRAFSYWANLPARCEERIDVLGGPDKRVYDAQCLTSYGYTKARSPRWANQ